MKARRGSYVVVLQATPCELREFAAYLSTIGVAGFEVIVADRSDAYETHQRVLRWVGRHVRVRGKDPLRISIDVASCDKVIVADERVRYSEEGLDALCGLLEMHEVVEPQDYFDPLPWWGGIDAGRMLVHRGIDPLPDHGATFGFRKSALRGLRSIDASVAVDDPARRLASEGAEVFSAIEVFVRRIPPLLAEWVRQRPRQAADDFNLPLRSALFFGLLPMALLLALVGGPQLAGGYACAIGFGALALAVRGRVGAAPFFPIRACFYAPLWVAERSLSVYWALFRRLRVTPSVSEGPARAVRESAARVTGR